MKGNGKTRFLCYRQDELFRLWWSWKNDCQIAGEVGCTPSAVCQWRKKNDLPPNDGRGRHPARRST